QEINTFGIDHSELGGMFISKWWDLDDRISQAIKYHHFPYPEEKMLSEYVKVINVANGIVTSYGISNGVEGVTDIFHEGAWDDLGLSLEEVDEFLEEAKRSVEQASEFIKS
ncbi:MAG: hypothetical protein GY863_23870, partial [bacterium]|nr:hypothetical protein [bacterium]